MFQHLWNVLLIIFLYFTFAGSDLILLPKNNSLSTNASRVCKECFAENLTILIETFKQNYPVELWKNAGFFTEDYIKQINSHWLKFLPPSKSHFNALAVLYFIIMAVGFCGNLLVIVLFIRCKSLRTPANNLILNLAISDLIMMSMIPIFLYNCLHFGPALGDIGCKFYGFLGGISGTVSICTLAVISLDRFYVIKFPLQKQSSYIRIKIFLIIAWIYGGTFSLIPVLDIGLGVYVPEAYLISCSYDYLTPDPKIKYFILSFFIAAWFVPFVAICYSYINIVHIVIVQRNLTKNNILAKESSRHIKEDQKRKQELKLAIIVLCVIALWFIAWTPYALVSLIGISGRADLITPFTSMVPALFCKSASCVDPYIYALTHPRFKAEFCSLFCKKRRSSGGISTVWSTSGRRSTKTSQTVGDRNEVTEEFVMVNLRSTLRQEPTVLQGMASIAETDLRKDSSQYKASWWMRPSFSNKSSMRRLVRTLSPRKRINNEE